VLVLDSSIGLSIVRDEPSALGALQIIREHKASRGTVLVPAMFWLEIVNVLASRYRRTPAEVLESVVRLDGIGLETIDLTRPQLLLAIDAVARHSLTAYDAAYIALAESSEAQLLTFDRRLASAAGIRARMPGDHTIAEAQGAYPQDPAWASWPGAASYLRELRARIRTPSAT
jgi:predicted nucleic acid-binding protein